MHGQSEVPNLCAQQHNESQRECPLFEGVPRASIIRVSVVDSRTLNSWILWSSLARAQLISSKLPFVHEKPICLLNTSSQDTHMAQLFATSSKCSVTDSYAWILTQHDSQR